MARETVASYGMDAGSGDFGGELERIPWDGKLDDSMIMILEDGNEDEDEGGD